MGKTFYTSNAGLKELKQEICNYLKRRMQVEYNYNTEVMVTIGGSEAIDAALRAMLDPGDEVLIPQPSYVSYVPCTILAGGVPVVIELEEKDLFVISDEIYAELTYKKKHMTIASLPGMRERTVLINGFSKAYAMTGWRIGYACAPALILKQMLKIHQYAIMCAPTTSQYAAVEAVKNGDADIEEMKRSYDERRRYLVKEFRSLGMDCFEPYGAFYMFPSIKRFHMTSEEFATRLLREEKIAIVPGTAFGDCGEGYLRVSYAYSLEDLKRAIRRIRRFVNRLDEENGAGEKSGQPDQEEKRAGKQR